MTRQAHETMCDNIIEKYTTFVKVLSWFNVKGHGEREERSLNVRFNGDD